MLGLATSTMAVSVQGQRPDDQIAPQSVGNIWAAAANRACRVAIFIVADDALETALVVDQRNRAAFNAMARVAIKQKPYGQAIRLTNRALALEPTDRDAIAVRGEAMVELGALSRAKEPSPSFRSCALRAARRSRCFGSDCARSGDGRGNHTPDQEKQLAQQASEADEVGDRDGLLARRDVSIPSSPRGVERARHPFETLP